MKRGIYDLILSRLAPLFRAAGLLSIGTAAGQAITMAVSPILTRLYSPDDMGVFGSFIGLTGIFVSVVCLSLDQALLLTRGQKGTVSVVGLCIASTALTTITFWCYCLLFDNWLIRSMTFESKFTLQALGSLIILVNGIFHINQMLSIRHQAFWKLATYQVIRSSISATAQLALSFMQIGAIGLVLGQIIGQTSSLLVFRRHANFIAAGVLSLRSPKQLLRVAHRFSKFVVFGTPQMILNSAAAGLPTVLLAGFYSPADAGLFWLAYRVFGLPNQVIAESVRGALYHQLARAHAAGRSLSSDVILGGLLIAILCFPFALVLAIAGPEMFGFVFGGEWQAAGTFAQILSLFWIVSNMSVPAAAALVVLERQGSFLALEIVFTTTRLSAMTLTGLAGSADGAVFLYGLIGAVHSFVVIGFALWAGTKNRASP